MAALPAMERVIRHKAGDEGVRAVVGRRFALYPQPDRSDGEWAAWWADYFDALADLPMVALEAAMASWVRDPDSEFMPKPGKLRDLALHEPNHAMRLHERLQTIAYHREPAPPPPPREIPEVGLKRIGADHARIRELMAEYPKPERRQPYRRGFPATHGKVDEGGLTQEMRALMARRSAEAEQGL